MKLNDINIRDPFILLDGGKYYMYGTRSETCWGPAEGFDVYVSEDLKTWEGPKEIFKRTDDFFSDHCFWAPECIALNGAYYLITTFGLDGSSKGIFILRSDKPEGPFEMYSEQLTPKDWICIDGHVYMDKETPYLYFSHSFEDSQTGDVCMMALSKNLKTAVEEPVKLFEAAQAPWAKPVPFAKAEFGLDGDVYFTDGPSVVAMEDGALYMTWSSWSRCGYAVGVAVSKSGDPYGPWIQQETPLYPENGGHGMMFRKMNGELQFLLHYPNDKYMERPVYYPVTLSEGQLMLIREN